MKRNRGTLAPVRQFVRDCVAIRWPGRAAAQCQKADPGCAKPPHAWREWRHETVGGRAIKLDACHLCDAVRVQDDRKHRSETSYVPYVRRTLFYVPGPAACPRPDEPASRP